jgi:tetratricopeptide (TPR) repeat protein
MKNSLALRGVPTCNVPHASMQNLPRAKCCLEFILTAVPLGNTYTLSGRVAEALLLLERVLEEADRSGFLYDHALYVAWLSEAYFLANRKEDALAVAQRALAGPSILAGTTAAQVCFAGATKITGHETC